MSRGPDIGEVARQHYALVYRFCARRVGLAAAQEAAQETFITAQRVLKKFRGDSSIRTWLIGIANNEGRRLSRSRRLDAPCIELQDVGDDAPFEQMIVDRHALAEALNKLS